MKELRFWIKNTGACAICNNPANPFIGTCPHGAVDSRFNQENRRSCCTCDLEDQIEALESRLCKGEECPHSARIEQTYKPTIKALEEETNQLKDQLASATDLANTQARELGVKEERNPYSGLAFRDLIDRLWMAWANKFLQALKLAQKNEELCRRMGDELKKMAIVFRREGEGSFDKTAEAIEELLSQYEKQWQEQQGTKDGFGKN